MGKKKLLIIVGSIIVVITAMIIVLLIGNKKPITYDISFETNGGSLVESQIVNEGEQVKKPVAPTKDGYLFVEWTYQGKTYDFSLGVTSDLTLTAKWVELEEDIETFIVKFETDGGTTISNQVVEKGNKVAKPIDPVKEGYTFEGWTLNGEIYDFEKIVGENTELKAKWEKVKETNNNTTKPTPTPTPTTPTPTPTTPTPPTTPTVKEYMVSFNSNGGSTVSAQTVTEGSKASRPQEPIRAGYNFGGWLLNGSTYDFNSAVNGNITLVAKWNQKTYTVGVTRVDAYSPDSILSVFEDGKQITVQSIRYDDGTYLCSGTNTTVNTNDIVGETSFIVVLSDGTQVRATLK